MNIREIIRTSSVTRWHIVRTHRQQNIAEHMYLTTMIARDMARLLLFNPEQCALLTEWLLIHDAPETLTGDLPTQTKVYIHKYMDFWKLEDLTSAEYARLRAAIDKTPVKTLAKLADLMEGIIFLHTEGVRVDDPTTHPYQVMTGCLEAYRQAVEQASDEYPDFAWHRLYGYREGVEQSPVQDLRGLVMDPLKMAEAR